MIDNKGKIKIYKIPSEKGLYAVSLAFCNERLASDKFKSEVLSDYKDPPDEVDGYDAEFLDLCVRYIIGLTICSTEDNLMERNIGALTLIVMDHIEMNGKIELPTLRKYMNCFSQMLRWAGIPDNEIKEAYLSVKKALISIFKEYIINPECGD